MMCELSMSVSVFTLEWSPLVAEEEEELTGWECVVTVADCSPTLPAISKTFNSSKIITLQALSSPESLDFVGRGMFLILIPEGGAWVIMFTLVRADQEVGEGDRHQGPVMRHWELVTTLAAGEGT